MDQWITVHEQMFGATHDIPSSESMGITKLDGASITSDNCASAQATSDNLIERVEEAVTETLQIEGEDRDPVVLKQACHHHLRNVWIGAVTKHLSKYLNNLLAADLSAINFRYRVTTMMDGILRAVDKEFSLPANYPKGHGDMFKHWLRKHHPGALLVALERATGSRQDLACEGAGAVYWNRR